ncbi:hypothetical protein AB4X15_02945 [Peribacillus simplex]|uniref:hypothetical protein n=1 Tax=Peribacillus simplex TaxID=1478 RepID=UPI0034E8B2BB
MTQQIAEQIAQDFTDFLDEFHTYPQPYDDAMDAEFYEQYARVLREQSKWGYFNWKTAPDGTPRPLFSPSSAGKDERQLYEKAIKSKADERKPNRNQRDWTGLGSQVGAYIQREIMLAERHFKKLTGKEPRFKFERTDRGEPAFEHFVKKIHEVEHNGEKFGLNGLPDGILHYVTDDGEILRVGLEVKSFQKSYTDFKKQSEPKNDHELQTHVYNEMYDLDYTIVLYHLTYGADWKRDFSRNKAYGRYFPREARNQLLDKYARVAKAWRIGKAPSVDLSGWNFNDYKTAIAKSITDEEYSQVKDTVRQAMRSGLPEWRKNIYVEAHDFIKEVRDQTKGEVG